jgi:hypothetical protein
MYVKPSTVQHILADAAVLAGVLTTQLQAIHLPPLASGILGVFGILLHPWTSIVAPPPTGSTSGPSTPGAPQ